MKTKAETNCSSEPATIAKDSSELHVNNSQGRARSRAVPAGRVSPDGGGESLEQYLREVSRWSLLSATEERALARRIARGDAEALNDLISRNLRLVVYWAKRYRSSGMPLQDLIQEGNIGLIRAAEKFDSKKGTRFSTYASWWIRQALARAICDKQDLIRIPVHMHQKLRRVERLLERKGTKEAGDAEIRKVIEGSGIVSFKEWDGARRLQQPISLDRRQDPDREGPIEVVDDRAADPIQTIYSEEMRGYVASLLAELPPRYQDVLRLRYGLDEGTEHTLEAIGARLKISRERVRQIQSEAIERISQLAGVPVRASAVTHRLPAPVPGLNRAAIMGRDAARKDSVGGRRPVPTSARARQRSGRSASTRRAS